jgi:hypothetical protein
MQYSTSNTLSPVSKYSIEQSGSHKLKALSNEIGPNQEFI